MPRAFVSNNKTSYMSRDGDLAYHSTEYFLLKVKRLQDKHICKECLNNKFNLMIIASRKTGNAVERNLLKRRLRVIFSEIEISNECSNKYVYVIIIRPNMKSIEFSYLKKMILEAIKINNKRIAYKSKIVSIV